MTYIFFLVSLWLDLAKECYFDWNKVVRHSLRTLFRFFCDSYCLSSFVFFSQLFFSCYFIRLHFVNVEINENVIEIVVMSYEEKYHEKKVGVRAYWLQQQQPRSFSNFIYYMALTGTHSVCRAGGGWLAADGLSRKWAPLCSRFIIFCVFVFSSHKIYIYDGRHGGIFHFVPFKMVPPTQSATTTTHFATIVIGWVAIYFWLATHIMRENRFVFVLALSPLQW